MERGRLSTRTINYHGGPGNDGHRARNDDGLAATASDRVGVDDASRMSATDGQDGGFGARTVVYGRSLGDDDSLLIDDNSLSC